MTRIDFYVLQSNDTQTRFEFACRLLDKAVKGDHQSVVALNSSQDQSTLEHTLLHFRPETYLPFRSHSDKDSAEPIILDTSGQGPYHDILICLKDELPENFSQYQRVIEIVTQDAHTLKSTRAHWAFFKDRGYPVHHHTV
ncbi:DNA polymerase III subunit chi [Gilvimarinus sp. 1_MG-2023]|uniref:DNA polymerase III subunit chi n=1 Tax=Gilvimarinus sp. 1_MG-2023 TaxID=3062638 RepID=UPI0026E3286C|nr:DNA polymerase III subunit chi [Gilvimarinus sp. 1_MG-2023]MDO6746060.1 DNA polymerase III subunit chi [Gilvimarinus sp. 1_MG-2023]